MRDVSTIGGYVPFSILKYMKKKHVSSFPVILRKRFMDNMIINLLYVIGIIILRTTFIRICTGVLSQKIFNNALKMGDITHAN